MLGGEGRVARPAGIRHIESLGYTVNRMTLLQTTGRRYRFTAWPTASNPDGIYRGGEQWVAEADDEYAAACELAQELGIELDDG